MPFKHPAAALCALVLAAPAAVAAESAYTKLDIENECVQVSEYEAGATFSCPGYKGYAVLFAEGDLRVSIKYGYSNAIHQAFWESFGPFNNAGNTIEWRLENKVPAAAIQRWFITSDPEGKNEQQVLVVSKVGQPGDGQACVVAYVDALANRDANALARDAADRLAVSFNCGLDQPEIVGQRGALDGIIMRSLPEGLNVRE